MFNNYSHIDSLVDRVKNKDTDALWELFDYYRPSIKQASIKVHNKYTFVEVDDLITESAFVLQELCEKYNKNLSYFSYYFDTRITAYLISKVKSKYSEKFTTVNFDNLSSEDILLEFNTSIEDFSELHSEIDNLPDNLKEAINLFYFKNLNQSECALILNISQPAFKKRLDKALGLLRKKIKNRL